MPRTTLARNAAPVARELRARAWTGGQRDGKLRLCGCKTVAGAMFKDETCFERFALLLVSVGVFGAAAFSAGLAAEGGGIAAQATSLWARMRGQAQREAPQVVARLTRAMQAEWEQWGKTSSHADEGLRAHALASFAEVIDRLNLDPATLVGARLDAQAVADLALRRAAEVFPESYGNTDPKNAEAQLTRKFLHSITLRAYGLLLEEPQFVSTLAPALWRGVQAGQDRIEEKIDALALSQREKEGLLVEVATLKAKLGTTQSMILTFLEDIRQRAVQPDQITAELFRIAGEWRSAGERIDALSRSQNMTPELNRLREQVKAAYDAEDVTRTLDLLTQIEVAEEKALNALLDHQREVADEIARRTDGVINSKAAKRDLYATQSNVAETVRLTVEIVQLGLAKGASLFAALRAEKLRWYERGRDKGLNFDLEVSVHLARASLTHATDADERGNGQNDLGVALKILGERRGSEDLLDQAITAYRAALTEWTQDRVPMDWAMTQNNFGNALQALGERRGSEDLLDQAISAYRAALTERTQDRVPLNWATTQNNLGIALQTLGQRRGSEDLLDQAITAYRATLTERRHDRVPLDWAMTQNNLGNALQTLGERRGSEDLLDQAVTAYRAALTEMKQDRVPLNWAMTQNNLGIALQALGERRGSEDLLDQAAIAYRAALTEWTKDRVPLDWAMTQNNLGTAVATLGERRGSEDLLEQAVNAFRTALTEYTQDRVPLDWAMSFGNQGVAMRMLAELRSDLPLAQQALDQLKAAEATMRNGGHIPFADLYAFQIPLAQALIDRLSAASP